MTDSNYEVFLGGELVDLVIPNERAIHVDGWHRWFNDPAIVANLGQGIFPNTVEQQLEFLADLRRSQKRLALMIRPRGEDHVVGVASLSNISFASRQADFAMVIGRKSPSFRSAFFGMEAKCLMTEHAFEHMGLERINSGQSAALKDWQRWQILFGYKVEGIKRGAFRKGRTVHDVVVSGCLLEDYLAVKEMRGGRLWPGYDRIMDLIRDLPKESLEQKVSAAIRGIVAEHYAGIRQT